MFNYLVLNKNSLINAFFVLKGIPEEIYCINPFKEPLP